MLSNKRVQDNLEEQSCSALGNERAIGMLVTSHWKSLAR